LSHRDLFAAFEKRYGEAAEVTIRTHIERSHQLVNAH
jgi:DNA-binding GntR family transcriptional regulator